MPPFRCNGHYRDRWCRDPGNTRKRKTTKGPGNVDNARHSTSIMPLFHKASKERGREDKLQKNIEQAKEALKDRQTVEQTVRELHSVVEQRQRKLKHLRKGVPELEKQLQPAKKINKEAQKEAKAIAKAAVKAIQKDPTI